MLLFHGLEGSTLPFGYIYIYMGGRGGEVILAFFFVLPAGSLYF